MIKNVQLQQKIKNRRCKTKYFTPHSVVSSIGEYIQQWAENESGATPRLKRLRLK